MVSGLAVSAKPSFIMRRTCLLAAFVASDAGFTLLAVLIASDDVVFPLLLLQLVISEGAPITLAPPTAIRVICNVIRVRIQAVESCETTGSCADTSSNSSTAVGHRRQSHHLPTAFGG